MCGIAGFYGFRNDNLIEKFSKELTHRGPDGEGFYTDDNASLLNRRLAIIDRKGGDQPIYNEDKSVVVTYNGEIYNFRELRWALEKRGHNFATKSDTEVIVHGYEEWGEICFERFNGMFAVALYDLKKKKLILARDHFGIKPLYFSFINNSSEILSRLNSNPDVHRDQSFLAQPQNLRNRVGTPFLKQKVSKNFDSLSSLSLQLMFSSEIKPLIYSGLIKKKPNDRIIYRYLKYRVHDDQRETFFAEVYRLMPGEYMTIQNSEFRIQNYTSLKEDLLNVKETERLGEYEIKKFKEKLIEAVRLRLISEVPVGTCLSGGLDSS
ncbi:asparagine synthetase B, partial [Candidatus Roizmanbacteria bacterium]|nr:asparagine synthetase B [Candidatus Roizmanbacteria bacterium]